MIQISSKLLPYSAMFLKIWFAVLQATMYSCFVNIFLALQDWDFPHFMNNFDIKLPGLNTASYSINLPKYFKREDWAIHITGETIATFLHAMTQVVILQMSGIVHVFQLDYIVCLTQVWQPLFPLFLWQNVRGCHPDRANLLGALLHVCINILFVSTPQNVDFPH